MQDAGQVGSFAQETYAKPRATLRMHARGRLDTEMKAEERLVGEARDRQPQRMAPREAAVVGGLALGFVVAVAVLGLVLPESARTADPVVLLGLVAMYAIASRVEFEVGSTYAVPEQLVFIPMLFLAPLPLVPLLVAAGFLLAQVPEFLEGKTHTDRWVFCLSDAWFTIGPITLLGFFGPGQPMLEHVEIYLLAFAAQVGTGLVSVTVREHLGHGVPFRESVRLGLMAYRIDAVLSPVGFVVAIVASEAPLALTAVGPLVWLLHVFSRERRERYAAALELNRAYRGTVMLLSDVVEAEDNYTANHCRSVVELVSAVADELAIETEARQELEFAALLHDVGKIAIPNEILNKPAALTDEEFDLMKTHTIEGQVLLNRVGGLLARVGQIVRSCHERWDGTGYPDRLSGYDIPLAARIVFCCDAYSAMTTDRPYRAAMSRETALEELWANAGTQFEPRVVAAVANAVWHDQVHDRSTDDAVRALIAGRPLAVDLETSA